MTDHSGGQVPVHQIIAAEVRAELARQRISGRQAARRLGWTQQFLSRRLTGEIPFDVAELADLAGLLDVTVSSFFPQMRGAGTRVSFPDRGSRKLLFTNYLAAGVAA